MEFGKVEGNVANIDFILPRDAESTSKTLQAAKNESTLKVYVGGTKWAEKSWKGKVYPKTMPESEFLSEYSRNFNTIEFGPTFYTMYSADEIKRWTDKVEMSPAFKFCPKFPQNITHMRRLANAEDFTSTFYNSITGFADHLGPMLLQLGENFSPKSLPQLTTYLETVPPNLKIALEVRHKDWFRNEAIRRNLFNLLNRLNISWIISDTSGRRDCIHMELPTADAIIRFVGNNLDGTDYTRIDEWVERLRVWNDQGLQSVWFFVHQHNEYCVPDLCDYFIDRINSKLGIDLMRPKLNIS